MSVSAAIGQFTRKARVSTTATWDAAYNVYKITTGATDTDFDVDTATIIPNLPYTVIKFDSGAGHIIVQDETPTEIVRLYAESDNITFFYDGTDFLIFD